MPWEEKLAKHHVEDGEDYNREEKRHIYINCHTLLHQYISLSPPRISLALIHESKTKWKYKKKRRRRTTLAYTKERKP